MKIDIEKIKSLFLGEKGRKIAVALGVLVMILLLFSTFSCGGEKEKTLDLPAENTAQIERELERRLCELISRVEGADDVSVMITLYSASSAVYEKDRKTSSQSSRGENQATENIQSETEVVLAGSAKEPLRVGTVLPKVRGAAVVCKGAEDPRVREKIANLVAKALDIGISKVYVTS